MTEKLQIGVQLANVIDETVDDRQGPIDVEASCKTYVRIVAKRLLTLYPGAHVHVTCDHQLSGAIHEEFSAEIPEALEGTVSKALGFATLREEIWFHITEIRKELQGRTDWVVYQSR